MITFETQEEFEFAVMEVVKYRLKIYLNTERKCATDGDGTYDTLQIALTDRDDGHNITCDECSL